MPSLEIKDVFDAPEVKPSTPSASPQVPQITKSFGHRKAWVVFAFEHAMSHLGHSIKKDLFSCFNFVPFLCGAAVCGLPLQKSASFPLTQPRIRSRQGSLLKGNKIWTANLDGYRCEAPLRIVIAVVCTTRRYCTLGHVGNGFL